MRVLIVDDNEKNIFALSAVLNAKGYSCIAANGAIEGLRLLDQHEDIGVLLVDMMMPEMDGYEMLAKIRMSAKAAVPVIAVTAQAMVGDKERCLAAGADDYIAKPIDIKLLIELLKNYNVQSFDSDRRCTT